MLGEQGVVVLESIAEQGEGVDERATAHDDLGASPREQIERGKVLKDAHRVGRAENGHGARESDPARAGRRGGENDGRRRVEILLAMVLADAEHVQPDVIGLLDLFDEVAKTICWADRETRFVVRRGEAVDADLHAFRAVH